VLFAAPLAFIAAMTGQNRANQGIIAAFRPAFISRATGLFTPSLNEFAMSA
jgi:hypothetical protein